MSKCSNLRTSVISEPFKVDFHMHCLGGISSDVVLQKLLKACITPVTTRQENKIKFGRSLFLGKVLAEIAAPVLPSSQDEAEAFSHISSY